MKIDTYVFPKSSFLSIDKDINTILDRLVKDNNLLKLLHYTNDKPLEGADLTEEDGWDMLGTEIRTVPKVAVDSSVLNYIILSFDNFTPNVGNDYFRDNIISFDIICHFDQWQTKGKYACLRPYRIAGEIDAIMNHSKLSGIGKIDFLGANQLILNDEFAGLSLMYTAVHGDDDTNPKSKNPDGSETYNPYLADLIAENFEAMQESE